MPKPRWPEAHNARAVLPRQHLMKNLFAACAAASLALGSAWAQDGASVAAATAANEATPGVVSKGSKKEAEKRPKPKPTKKSKKPATRSSNA
jgi:hypothetical protein